MKTNNFLAMQIVLKQEKDMNALLNKCWVFLKYEMKTIFDNSSTRMTSEWMDE